VIRSSGLGFERVPRLLPALRFVSLFPNIAFREGTHMPETLSPTPSQSEQNTAKGRLGREDLYRLLRIVAAVNVVCFALVWTTSQAQDYRAFYGAGRIALTSPHQVYSVETQRSELKKLPGDVPWVPYLHAPTELALFAPLAKLPYRQSHALWTAISIAFLFASIAVLSSVTGIGRRRLLSLALALFSSCFVLFQGQDTFLLLLLICLALLFVQRKQDIRAGIVLALALFKPQIPLILAFAFLLRGRRKLAASFSVSSVLLGLASVAAIGRDGVRHFLDLIHTVEPLDAVWRMSNLRGLLSLVHTPRPVTISISIVVLAAFTVYWYRTQRPLMHVASSAIIVGMFLSFHFHVYDLALLVIPLTELLSAELSTAELVAIFSIAAVPVFTFLLEMKVVALLAIPLFVLALHPAIQSWRRPVRAAT
jgi:hypothetical protein